MASNQTNTDGSSYLYPTGENDDESTLSKRWKSLKDIFTNAAQAGTQDTQNAIDTGNYYLRPTDAAGGEGMLAMGQALSDSISPTSDELQNAKNKQLQTQVNNGVPIIPGQEDMPVVYPDVTAIVSPEVEATRFGKSLGLQGGMTEDQALGNIMEQGVRGSSTANGAGLIDKTGTNNITVMKNRIINSLKDQGIANIADTTIDILATPQYESEEKQMGMTPGSTAGLYNANQNRILVNQGAGDPTQVASTLSHEIQHSVDVANNPSFQSKSYNKNLPNISPDQYTDKFNDLVNRGDINGAIQLENQRKAGHIFGYNNFELENALQNLAKYSKDADPDDMKVILNNFPQLRQYFLK